MSFSPFADDNPATPKRRISSAAKRRVHARERRIRRTQKAARAQLPTGYPQVTLPYSSPQQAPTTYQPTGYQAQPDYHQAPVYSQPPAEYQQAPQHQQPTEYQAPPQNHSATNQAPPQWYHPTNPLAA